MSKLKLRSIRISEKYYFVTLTSGEHETKIIEDRHDIDIEVMVSLSTKIEDIEAEAMDKAYRFVKELLSS